MKFIILAIMLSMVAFASAQNPKGFDRMCTNYLHFTIPILTPQQLQDSLLKKKRVVLLDAREDKEYGVSHLPNALRVGYDSLDWNMISSLDKSNPVVVYCSIGYRSEKVAEKLKERGFERVYNLYGGIFSWGNQGFELRDDKNLKTKKVHGFNSDWAKWLNQKECVPIVD